MDKELFKNFLKDFEDEFKKELNEPEIFQPSEISFIENSFRIALLKTEDIYFDIILSLKNKIGE